MLDANAVHKVTLKSGRVVMLRDPLISDTEHACAVAGKGAENNQALLGVKMQKEMLKLLIVSIGKDNDQGVYEGSKPSLQELQLMDRLFNVKEYGQLLQVVRKLTEPDEEGNESSEIAFEASPDK